jgi:hypothetical protein
MRCPSLSPHAKADLVQFLERWLSDHIAPEHGTRIDIAARLDGNRWKFTMSSGPLLSMNVETGECRAPDTFAIDLGDAA